MEKKTDGSDVSIEVYSRSLSHAACSMRQESASTLLKWALSNATGAGTVYQKIQMRIHPQGGSS
jgi:hypothetical protein